jgi:ACS family sodium-dependent inorganic phosphate cotransporter
LIGYLFSGIPGGFLCNRFGGKHVMSAAALLWSLFTVLTPLAARSSYPALITCRILLGAAEGLAWPAVHQLIPQWFPTDELGRAVSIFTSGSYFGTVITLFMSPPMITAYGWPSVFYFFGSLGFGFVLVWNWKITETPSEQSSISHDELVYIESNSQRASHSAPTHIPWSLLFTSKQLWAFYLNLFASGWSFYVLLAWMPQYFKDALHVDFDSIGFMTLAPYFFQVSQSVRAATSIDLCIMYQYSTGSMCNWIGITISTSRIA